MLQYNKEFIINPDNIASILKDAKPEWEKRKKLYEMKNRKRHTFDLVATNDSNIKVGFESVVSNMISGYMGGKAPIYQVEEMPTEEKQNILKKLFDKIFNKTDNDRKEYQVFIDFIRDYNDDPYFYYKLVQDYVDMTAGYGIFYENEDNEIVYANTDPRQTIALYDFSTPVKKIGLLRHWEETDATGEKYDVVLVTTEEFRYYFKNSKLQADDFYEDEETRETISWGCVPCIAIENPDGLACFELAKSCICAYERVMNNSKNTFQYNDDAKLMVTGYEPKEETLIEKREKKLVDKVDEFGDVETDDEGNVIQVEQEEIVYDENGETIWIPNIKRQKEDEVVLQAPVFYAGEGGSIEWVEKNINDSALQNYKKTLIDLIFMISNCPNVNDLGFTNADNSSALEKKFFPLEQSVAYLDKSLRKELLAMWEAFTNRINLKKGTNYDFRNLKIKLQRNMPTDKQAETTRALSLRGLICDESVINLLPDELDASSEIEKMKTQSEENLEENMKKIESFGNGDKGEDNKEDSKDSTNNDNSNNPIFNKGKGATEVQVKEK